MNHNILAGLTAALLLSSVAAFAEPVGDIPPISDSTRKIHEMQGKSIDDALAEYKADIPSKEEVGIPVYPGSFYTTKFEAEGMLPAVTLASKDSIDEVSAWYEEQGLKWSDMAQMYYVGEKYEFMKSETVFLQDISEDPSESAGGLAFDMSGMKTQITISYKP